MPPKGGNRRKFAPGLASEPSSTPQTPTLIESLSYQHIPKPFKNPNYIKNINRRTKNLKAVLTQERERERVERERRRQEREEEINAGRLSRDAPEEEIPTYTSIEAAPSILPQKHYCDITGLEAPYTDPATGLRYHDKSVYELIKTFNPSTAKEYLVARGVNPIVK
ncbi:hypothetical protein BD410DRAFT_900509 [Rickenella mellea]|uniref:Vps72/YL1 C-terminal domain-containing protein n=1 Tax=Rickenella mellea TaxID=50990 RepID=A0A4Y7PUD8_9AGAM|nr:hypothetical protein BD410DRAFT_900509 [Rickenella mellea]